MKKVITIIITGIVVFIVVTLLINNCANIIRNRIDDETKKENISKEKKYDINAPFSEYNLDYYYGYLRDYIVYINKNYVDKKFLEYTDISAVIKYYERWGKKESTGVDVINTIVYNAQKNIFAYMFRSGSDWTDLPITDNFRAKFGEAGSIADYYNLPEGLIDRGEQNGFSIIITDNIPKDYDSIKYEFICFFNDDGYFDNIYYLGKNMEEHIYDVEMIPLEYEMNNIDYIKWCVHELCVSEEYLMKGGDELTDFDIHIKQMNTYCINYKYRDKVFHSNGILPIKDYLKDSLEVISYDENTKEAIVKIETEDKKIFYRIRLDISETYSLENATVELDREEDK